MSHFWKKQKNLIKVFKLLFSPPQKVPKWFPNRNQTSCILFLRLKQVYGVILYLTTVHLVTVRSYDSSGGGGKRVRRVLHTYDRCDPKSSRLLLNTQINTVGRDLVWSSSLTPLPRHTQTDFTPFWTICESGGDPFRDVKSMGKPGSLNNRATHLTTAAIRLTAVSRKASKMGQNPHLEPMPRFSDRNVGPP